MSDIAIEQIRRILEHVKLDNSSLDLDPIDTDNMTMKQAADRASANLADLSERLEKLEKKANDILNLYEHGIEKFACKKDLDDEEKRALLLAAIYENALLNVKYAMEHDMEYDTKEERGAAEDTKESKEEDVEDTPKKEDAYKEEDASEQAAENVNVEEGDMSGPPTLNNILDEINKQVGLEEPSEVKEVNDAVETIDKVLDDVFSGAADEVKKDVMPESEEDTAMAAKDDVMEYKTMEGEEPSKAEEANTEENTEEDTDEEEVNAVKEALFNERNVAAISSAMEDLKYTPEDLEKMAEYKGLPNKGLILKKIASDVRTFRVLKKKATTKEKDDVVLKSIMKAYLESLIN